jgi:hypothetical protein
MFKSCAIADGVAAWPLRHILKCLESVSCAPAQDARSSLLSFARIVVLPLLRAAVHILAERSVVGGGFYRRESHIYSEKRLRRVPTREPIRLTKGH